MCVILLSYTLHAVKISPLSKFKKNSTLLHSPGATICWRCAQSSLAKSLPETTINLRFVCLFTVPPFANVNQKNKMTRYSIQEHKKKTYIRWQSYCLALYSTRLIKSKRYSIPTLFNVPISMLRPISIRILVI